ncbi:hypothetical protein [Paenibacillus soyae]|uniref:DUF4064 domain-containing protein n=1 Tax=Paenibacillus soyae TaxID=2969249 RepID=A0A9X2MQ66_9BACL|nr:hypothetical protein [Paenibacillus soyae]MCR2804370.1 hypothetical protein [Paenibacillus soyae]
MTNEQNPNNYDPNEQNRPQNYSNTGYTNFSPVTDYPGNAPVKMKHSGLGIASFVLALVAVLTIVIGIIMSVAAVASSPDFMNATEDEIATDILEGGGGEFATLMGAGLLMLLSIGISIVGLILGIIAVVLKNRKKVFGIIGLILNALMVLGVVMLFAIGLVAS